MAGIVQERSPVLFNPHGRFDGYRFRGFRGEQQRATRSFLEGVFQRKGEARASGWVDQPGDYLTLLTFPARTPTRLVLLAYS